MKKPTYKVFQAVTDRGYITEQEINLLKGRMNRTAENIYIEKPLNISNEQSEKGKNWILTRLAKKNGEPRKGFEGFANLIELAQEKESKFTFEGFANIGYFFAFYVPIYRLSNGLRSFSYHCTGQGQIKER